MCGIAGLLTASGNGDRLIRPMIDAIEHRGPDDQGWWTDAEAGVTLGHRRLSIIDLSPLGHQPMPSSDGRYQITYNGEIYNHAALRQELEQATGLSGNGPRWRGHSDTETLLECIAHWGLQATLRKCVGMYAFGLWDRRDRLLHLVRDRFGEKPLHYGWVGRDFLFGSELKAFRTHPDFNNRVDRRALHRFASRGYVPGPDSIFENIFKLQPGCVLTIAPDGWRKRRSAAPEPNALANGLTVTPYWSYRDIVEQGLDAPISDENEAIERLDTVLGEAIKGQSVADVPVGAFLSGGIDSSTIVALYQKHSSRSVRTFSIGFEDAAFNEANYARDVARHFGTEHNERIVTVDETREVIPLLPSMYDEPFADSSQIPTHIVSRFAREQVTVALSGDAGDELFGGYNRHIEAPRLWNRVSGLPAPLRRAAGSGLGAVSPAVWNRIAALASSGPRHPSFGGKVQKALRVIGRAKSLDDVYDRFLDEWSGVEKVVLGISEVPDREIDLCSKAPGAVRLMYRDAMSYLPDDILCKVDRAAMAVSLETRVPFLDHRVAELAARIPIELKIRNGQGKHILRRLLYRYAPPALFERPKTGFAVPVGDWIRGPLRPWAEDLLDQDMLRRQNLFDPIAVHGRWQRHLRGGRDETQALWSVLMFQAWHAETIAD